MTEPETVEAHWRRYMPSAASESPQRPPRTRIGAPIGFLRDLRHRSLRMPDFGGDTSPIYGVSGRVKQARADVRSSLPAFPVAPLAEIPPSRLVEDRASPPLTEGADEKSSSATQAHVGCVKGLSTPFIKISGHGFDYPAAQGNQRVPCQEDLQRPRDPLSINDGPPSVFSLFSMALSRKRLNIIPVEMKVAMMRKKARFHSQGDDAGSSELFPEFFRLNS